VTATVMAAVPAVVMAAVIGLSLTLSAAAASAQQGSWVHVRVAEEGGASFNLDLPISLVSAALSMADERAEGESTVRFGTEGMDVAGLREIWRELSAAGDAEFLRMEEGGETVRIFREGDRVSFHADEGDTKRIRIEVPFSVVDVLLGTEGDSLDVVGALEELARTGNGDVVEIMDGGSTVRAWVDRNPG
jgi:hypothetical protein